MEAKARFRILVIALSDDPLDPPGHGRYGGAHLFVFDLGRYLVRNGFEVIYISRKSRPDKPEFQRLGPRCRIYRIKAGEEAEVPHHGLHALAKQINSGVASVLEKEEPFDAVMSHNWISGIAAIDTGVKPHYHHILSLGRVRKSLFEEPSNSDSARDVGESKVFAHANVLICATKNELEALQELYDDIDDSKTTVISYAVNSSNYKRRPYDTNSFLRWASERFEKGI